MADGADASLRPVRARPPELPGLALHDVIGRGGMSVVWRGTDLARNIPVAVKILQRDFADDRDDLHQFFQEARVAAMVRHPGIVKGYGLNRKNGLYYIVMEYVDGYNLGQLLERKKRLSEYDVLAVAESVAGALDFAWTRHRIVHCDIKPENIMVNSDGAVKLSDLGLSHTISLLSKASGGQAAEIVGTPAYMAPELISGESAVDCRSDIYSLGATMYHLATGRTLFPLDGNDDILRAHVDPAMRAPDPQSIVPSLSHGFSRLAEAMLVKDPAHRIKNWSRVLEIVRTLIVGGRAAFLRIGSPSSVEIAPAR